MAKTSDNKAPNGVSVKVFDKRLNNGKIQSILAVRAFTHVKGKYLIQLETGYMSEGSISMGMFQP